MSVEQEWYDEMIGEAVRLYTTNAVLYGTLLKHDDTVVVIKADNMPPLMVYKDYIISCSATWRKEAECAP
jgi:hypothetical protein